ncbi:MAG: hypothetical protein WCF98_12430, partial [Synechococcus sp. ELA057]
MATADSQEPRSDLPAPYRSPWRNLREAITAVTADLRLRLQELVRHNRQGELPRPGFWPEAAAGLFWPLVLGLSLCLIIAAIAGLRPARPASLVAGSPLDPPTSSPVSALQRTQPPE